ncbi:MAG: nickel pincer cofactor biosynthesis protein LarC [Lachnospiraceae bacterium]|nr:nickel pincer cofactor biosynthesis protein LarC [Lachnospiraceae bacterium]
MKTLYLDLGMGAAGDMLCSALMELLPDPDRFIEELNGLGIPGVVMTKESSVKCGITGTHFTVKVNEVEEDEHLHEHSHVHSHDHGHIHSHETVNDEASHGNHVHHSHTHGTHEGYAHNGLSEIQHIVSHLTIPENVKSDILAVYDLIAKAESHVHGVPVEHIHFHEVGSMDAVADITAVCLLMDRIRPDEVIASPVHVGYGTVRCAHGILPVPAPATAYLLRDIPVYAGRIQGELCTPTGAALLRHFVDRFGEMPVMKIQNIGYGMGKKDFERANCVRAMLGEREDQTGKIVELNCNVDDMTGEEMGFALEELIAGGAMDVFTIPIGMKKSRPGTMICVICREGDKEKMVRLLFKHTTTLGIREKDCDRYTLERTIAAVDTPFGEIRRKDSYGYGVIRSKYEYEDLARIAREQGMSLSEVKDKLGV